VSLKRTRDSILSVFARLFVLLTGGLGIWNGVRELDQAAELLQRVATATELTYGVLGILGGIALHERRRWARPVVAGWGVALASTGALAPVAWGEGGLGASLATGGVTALLAGLVVRLTRVPASGSGNAQSPDRA